MTDQEAHAYIAGLIDGEGCIYITRVGGVRVAVSMTRPEAIEFVKARYGGSSYYVDRAKERKGHKSIFEWRVESKKAERLLYDIRPYLLIKRAQCDIAISVREHIRRGGVLSRGRNKAKDPTRDDSVVAFREAARTRMHELNKRGTN